MLEKIIDNTSEYIDSMPKKERKKYGQFFTSIETARYMAELFEIPQNQDKISLLDAGAGSGQYGSGEGAGHHHQVPGRAHGI